MLSIETPPGPPCPCKAPALRNDERASDQLALQEGDLVGLGETQTPNFSIRDYVFTSRSNGIATNWPFPQQFLQLCLQHGVRDVLPPFEPPDSLRTQCCRKVVESEQLVACAGDEKVPSQVESVEIEDVGLVDKEPRKALYPLSEEAKQTVDQGDTLVDESIEGNAEIFSAVINPDQIKIISEQISERHCSVQVTWSVSEASSEVEVAEPHPFPSTLEVLRDPAEKKCRLIVKSGAVTETSRAEDIVSTSSTVSDSMASKVCPVCKTFASTSNTTLNAHIDQCLSTESNTKWLVSEIPKPKGKPRKKRLMVDIYATAAHCTLEDLDRRNGTNWATELAWVAPTNEAYTEVKRPKLSPVVTRDDGNEEAVYVDSNGIKLRILSKFNDAPPSLTRENFKLKKHAKDIKDGESLLTSKKNCFGSKYSKYMKVKPQTKKLSSFNLFNGEIKAAPGGNHHANTHQEKEVSPLEMSNDHESINIGTSATLRNWVCSKRSDLPKRLNHKDIHNLGNSVLKTTRNLLAENNPTDVANSSVVKHDILKFSRPLEDMASSPKVKSVDFLSSTIPIMDNGKKKSPKPSVVNSKWSSDSTSTNHLTLKVPRSLETSISSPRSQRDEIDKITVRKSDNSSITTMKPSKSCHPSLKTKRSSTMKNSALVRRSCFLLEQSKCDAIGQPSTSKKFRKQRSILGAGKQGELPSNVDEGLCHSIKHCGIVTPRTGKKCRTHRSDLSENFKWSRTEETMGHLSPSRSNIPESEGKDASTIEKPKYTSLKQWHPRIESHDPQLAFSTEKAGGDPVYSETAILKSLAPTSSAKLDPRPPVEEFVYSVCGSEAHLEPMAENLCGEQDIQYSHVAHDEVVSQSIQVTDEVEFRAEAETYAAHKTKYQAETTSVQESSACLTSHGDAVLEFPRENSSVTSIRMASDQDQNLAIDRERQGSPVSTASTISPRSPKHPESKDPEAEPMMRHTVQDRAGFSMVPCSATIDRTEGRNKERRNEEAKAFSLAKEPEKFSDDHPCCCSRREGLPRESQFSRQNVMAGTMLQSKGMQISSLNIVPGVSSSFSSYPSLRADAKVVPILESPTGSITTKASTESAVTAPACIDFSSPSPSPRTPANSTSSSILRLMGKNLMVANKEEFQLPTVHHSASETPSNTKCSPPPSFASTGWESFSYHRQQLPCGSAFFGQAPSMVNQHFAMYSNDVRVGGSASPLQAGLKMKPDQPIHREFSKKPSAPSASNVDRISTPHPHYQRPPSSSETDKMREVIVIDDSPEFEAEHKYTPVVGTWPAIPFPNPMQQRPFPCFPSQGPFISRGYANTAKRGKASEVSDPLLQRPLVFQSPPTGHLKPPVYYFQTLR